MSKTLSEILEEALPKEVHGHVSSVGIVHDIDANLNKRAKTAQAIEKAIIDIIGEDEDTPIAAQVEYFRVRNELRATQTKRLNQWLGK